MPDRSSSSSIFGGLLIVILSPYLLAPISIVHRFIIIGGIIGNIAMMFTILPRVALPERILGYMIIACVGLMAKPWVEVSVLPLIPLANRPPLGFEWSIPICLIAWVIVSILNDCWVLTSAVSARTRPQPPPYSGIKGSELTGPELVASTADGTTESNVSRLQTSEKRFLRVILASPNDVQQERELIPSIIDELNRGIADTLHVQLDLVRWELDTYPAFHVD
jgi:hypothetical protein